MMPTTPPTLGVIFIREQGISLYKILWKEQRVIFLEERTCGQNIEWLDPYITSASIKQWIVFMDTSHYSLAWDTLPEGLGFKDRYDWKWHKQRSLRMQSNLHSFINLGGRLFQRISIPQQALTHCINLLYARYPHKFIGTYLAIAEMLPFLQEVVHSIVNPTERARCLVVALSKSARMYHVAYDQGNPTVSRVFEGSHEKGMMSPDTIHRELKHTLRYILQHSPYEQNPLSTTLLLLAPSQLMLSSLTYDFPYLVKTVSFQNIACLFGASNDRPHRFIELFLLWATRTKGNFKAPLQGIHQTSFTKSFLSKPSSLKGMVSFSKKLVGWSTSTTFACSALLQWNLYKQHLSLHALKLESLSLAKVLTEKRKIEAHEEYSMDRVTQKPKFSIAHILKSIACCNTVGALYKIIWKGSRENTTASLFFLGGVSDKTLAHLQQMFPNFTFSIKPITLSHHKMTLISIKAQDNLLSKNGNIEENKGDKDTV